MADCPQKRNVYVVWSCIELADITCVLVGRLEPMIANYIRLTSNRNEYLWIRSMVFKVQLRCQSTYRSRFGLLCCNAEIHLSHSLFCDRKTKNVTINLVDKQHQNHVLWIDPPDNKFSACWLNNTIYVKNNLSSCCNAILDEWFSCFECFFDSCLWWFGH